MAGKISGMARIHVCQHDVKNIPSTDGRQAQVDQQPTHTRNKERHCNIIQVRNNIAYIVSILWLFQGWIQDFVKVRVTQLSEKFSDKKELSEIWGLPQNSLTSGGGA